MKRTCLALTLFLLGTGLADAQDLVSGRGRSESDRGESRVMARLRNGSLDVAWTDLSLADCVADLRRRTGLNIFLSAGAAEAEFRLSDLHLRRASPLLLIQLLAEESGLVARFRANLVVFETETESVARTAVLAIYDLGSRFYQAPDFPAPRIGIRPTMDDDFEDVIRPEAQDFQDIVDILKSATGEASWEIDGVSMQVAGRRLVVRHTPLMQDRVARLLDALSACY